MSGVPDDPRAHEPEAPLEGAPPPPRVSPHEEPPVTHGGREAAASSQGADPPPAVGTRGGPASWSRAVEGAPVTLARAGWGDAAWSFLYTSDTGYAAAEDPGDDAICAANRRGRGGPPADDAVVGPMMKPPVWTWEVPLYFWIGGIAAGASFVGLAADLAGDHRSAAIARRVAVGAVLPAPLLLIADLGRPARFLNMLRIFKPRSPMNLGAWCLVSFSAVGTAASAADLFGRPRAARALGGANAVLGGYLGSYTGVLLATTNVPLWARARLFLGPIFVATATATGAAATRLTLVAAGLPHGHPTRRALGSLEAGAMLTELTLSTLNEKALGRAGEPLEKGRAGTLHRTAKTLVHVGLFLQAGRRFARGDAWDARRLPDLASAVYLAAGLAFRYAWVEAGKASARDDVAVARMARGDVTPQDAGRVGPPAGARAESELRAPAAPAVTRVGRVWTEAVRRGSLLAETALGRRGR